MSNSAGLFVQAIIAICALALLPLDTTTAAQGRLPDFSGRWVLVESSGGIPDGPNTLSISAPDELEITQTPLAITIHHPSKPGTHPTAGTFRFGIGGTVGPRGGSDSRWDVSWLGSQLIISDSMTFPPDANGARITVAYGSIWSVDPNGRLIIEFAERRTGANSKKATHVYVRKKK